MKLQTVEPAVFPTRCTYRTASGRQCRLPIFDPQSGLCANHHADQKQNERSDVADVLFRDAQDFQTAKGINLSLRCLYWLVAKNRISARRARALTHISSLLSAHPAGHGRRASRRNHLHHPEFVRARPNPETVMTKSCSGQPGLSGSETQEERGEKRGTEN